MKRRSTRMKKNRSYRRALSNSLVVSYQLEQQFEAVTGHDQMATVANAASGKNIFSQSNSSNIQQQLLETANEMEFATDQFKKEIICDPVTVQQLIGVFNVYKHIYEQLHQIHFEVQNNSFDVTAF